jgi:hypothetical protein
MSNVLFWLGIGGLVVCLGPPAIYITALCWTMGSLRGKYLYYFIQKGVDEHGKTPHQ